MEGIEKQKEEVTMEVKEGTQKDSVSDEALEQVSGGYYPQEYRDKKKQERIYE